MLFASLNSLTAALKLIAVHCSNPNSYLESLLKNEHATEFRTQVYYLETSSDQGLRAKSDDQSVLAQYLLYRF
jgi:hypothetical protein